MNKIQKLEVQVTKWYMLRIDIPKEEFRIQRKVIRKRCREISKRYYKNNYKRALESEYGIWTDDIFHRV